MTTWRIKLRGLESGRRYEYEVEAGTLAQALWKARERARHDATGRDQRFSLIARDEVKGS